jgi:hypothetical protein
LRKGKGKGKGKEKTRHTESIKTAGSGAYRVSSLPRRSLDDRSLEQQQEMETWTCERLGIIAEPKAAL